LLVEYHKLLDHSTRKDIFSWNELEEEIKKLKPEKRIEIDWNLENDYSNTDNKIKYKLAYVSSNKKSTHSPSDLYIYVAFPKNRTVNNSNLLILYINCYYEKKQI